MKFCSESRSHLHAKASGGVVSLLAVLAFFFLITGCASHPQQPPASRFDFNRDTFAYPNDLLWIYGYDTNGHWTSHSRPKTEKPGYSLHCFVVARSAAQFFKFARFDPETPPVDDQRYRKLIRQVVKEYPDKNLPDSERIVFPGYPDLRSFSEEKEQLLKQACGGWTQSYFQRGHWRMVFPFTRHQQEETANRLIKAIETNGVAVVHLCAFPSLRINHAVLLYAANSGPQNVEFSAYDPNDPSKPTTLSFVRATKTFSFPANNYFEGGSLNVYQVYHRWNY